MFQGAEYVGMYESDMKHGLGVYVMPTGERFEGEYQVLPFFIYILK
jgi:hypothetical protein